MGMQPLFLRAVSALQSPNPHHTRSYTLPALPSPPSPCHRTQAVLRLLAFATQPYADFVSGVSDGVADQPHVNVYCRRLLKGYYRQVMDVEDKCRALAEGEEERELGGTTSQPPVLHQRMKLLVDRWVQIREILSECTRALDGE